VHYLPETEPLALGDILSSQVTFVTNQEFEQLRQIVPSQPQGLPPAALVEAARIALPFLSSDLINSSIGIMEEYCSTILMQIPCQLQLSPGNMGGT
jgi:hypothetical protein